MYLMVQLKVSCQKDDDTNCDRYVCIFVCPNEECFRQLQFDRGFSSGGQGLFKCMERSVPVESSASTTISAHTVNIATKVAWYSDDNDNKEEDDWGMDGDDDTNALERAVAAMEENLDAGGALSSLNKIPSKKLFTNEKKSRSGETLQDAFGCYLLKIQDEPLPARPIIEEDDVGMVESDEKIRNMLARYMAEEEDEDILAALRGTEFGSGGGGKGEEDERLSDEDRILRGFQDRLRRMPRQVVRYARGGLPIWSLPDRDTKTGKQVWQVPECQCCGEPRRFEFQVLPSILATLDVEKASKSQSKNVNRKQALDDMLSDGMNFGSIAVFACTNAACTVESKEAYVVIQESVDDLPERREPLERDFSSATMAVVEDLDDDDEFELDG
jgi:hypothetical protein